MTIGRQGPVYGARRPILRVLFTLVMNAVALLLASWLLDGFTLGSDRQALGLAIVLGVVNALIGPVLTRLTLPVTVLTLGFGGLVVTGVLVLLAAKVYGHGVQVDGILTGIAVALIVAVVNCVVTAVLSIDDDDFWYRNVVRRQSRRHGYASATGGEAPGILFLEIDGLGHEVLRLAMRAGSAPTMARMLRDGSHNLMGWECDWSSQTGAMQAGILHGSNWDMPAFRWWEKERGRAMVSNRPRDAAEIEARHSNGVGLLHDGGASRANLVSGDAPFSLLTMSTVLSRRSGPVGRDYYAYFANPYSMVRTMALVTAEVATELWQQTRQKRMDIVPRVHRGWFPFPLLRAFTNVIQRDLEVAATVQDLYAGRPVIYTMFLGYDEVAHHSGIERAETLRELQKIDRQIARLERAAFDAPREYELVMLSDHGQTQGATFRQRYGETLEDIVNELTRADNVEATGQGDEGWGYVSAAATEIAGAGGALAAGVRAVTHRSRKDDGAVELGARRDEAGRRRKAAADSESVPEVVVMASGCLGLVYLAREPGRVTLERMAELYPHLVEGLRRHPGIGFLLVRSTEHGAVVLGPSGTRFLADDRIEGEDPLEPFGPNAARHLRRTDSFPHCADIAVNSAFWDDVGEVAAFEELVGSHGGMGGAQSYPFVLYPTALGAPSDAVVGAEQLHLLFRSWLAALGHEAFSAPFVPAHAQREAADR
ncbi:MAG TPA: phage holin family protein [Gaiellales bacterium]|nr:phage holin family protein [Gaiellales bacterium]